MLLPNSSKKANKIVEIELFQHTFNEKIVKNDSFTSIHIEEFEVLARDTKLGKEEITRDIPGLGEDTLKDLDECGIIRIGAEIKANDILVGKIAAKEKLVHSVADKLLHPYFNEKQLNPKEQPAKGD